MPRRRIAMILGLLAVSATLVACGTRDNSVSKRSGDIYKGSVLFTQHCAGCHTLDVVGTIGSATKVRDRERVDGPNFNTRHEQVNQVLYAIRNGGFSGAIMPENIVVGNDAMDIAKFLAKYAGRKAPKAATASQAAGGG